MNNIFTLNSDSIGIISPCGRKGTNAIGLPDGLFRDHTFASFFCRGGGTAVTDAVGSGGRKRRSRNRRP